jgi:hypothetical protein
MSTKQRWTIVVKHDGVSYKICKIWFGSDGSYYATVPYHKANQAVLVKTTVNYEAGPIQNIPVSDMLEIAALEDEGRLKLSHHPDGYCQFSGEGILSGRDESGRPKGIGIYARDLMHVAGGPTFVIAFHGLEGFSLCENLNANCIVFDADRLVPIHDARGFRLEAYYLGPAFRRFVETAEDGARTVSIIHPTSAILRLKAIIADASCAIPAVIGLHLYADDATPGGSTSGFAITGPGGNLRDNPQGENIGDMISAIYPRHEAFPIRRKVNFPPKETE